MKKHAGRNLVAIVLAGVVIKLLTEIMHLHFDRYQLSCIYMLLYLCLIPQEKLFVYRLGIVRIHS